MLSPGRLLGGREAVRFPLPPPLAGCHGDLPSPKTGGELGGGGGKTPLPSTLSGGVLGSQAGRVAWSFLCPAPGFAASWCEVPCTIPQICPAPGNPRGPRPDPKPERRSHTLAQGSVENLPGPVGRRPGEVGAPFPHSLRPLFPQETGVGLPPPPSAPGPGRARH